MSLPNVVNYRIKLIARNQIVNLLLGVSSESFRTTARLPKLQNVGFIKRVAKGRITTLEDLETWHSER